MLPAVIGMSLLVIPLYTLFYEHPSGLQASLFVFAILQSFLLGLYLTVFPTLSIMNYKKTSMKFFGWTLLVKLILQVPAIMLFHSYGPLVSTTFAFGFGVWLFIKKLYEITLFSKKNVMKTFYAVSLITAVMGVIVILVELLLGLIFGSHPSRTESAIIVLIGGAVGLYVYLFISAKLGMLEKILGARASSVRRKLHI
jgi:O-antigen/teichoic acid export membrane protein